MNRPVLLAAIFLAGALQAASVLTPDGEVKGKPLSLDAQGLTIEAEAGTTKIDFGRLIGAEMGQVAPRERTATAYLADGGNIRADSVSLSGTGVAFKSEFVQFTLPSEEIVCMVFRDVTPEELLAKRREGADCLFVSTGDETDIVQGIIESMDEKEVRLSTGFGPVKVSRARLRGIAMVKPPATRNFSAPSVRLTLLDGTQLAGDLGAASKDRAVLTLRGKTVVEIPLQAIARIENIGSGLARLEQMEFKTEPAVSRPVFPLPVRRHRSLWGNSLRIGGRTFAQGISVQPATSLIFSMNGAFARLKGLAGIDDEVAAGSAVVIVEGDGKELARLRLQRGAATPLECSVQGTRVLTIRVTDGGDGNIGDHVDLVDMLLVKQ